MKKVNNYINQNTTKYGLVGNKTDLYHQHAVDNKTYFFNF